MPRHQFGSGAPGRGFFSIVGELSYGKGSVQNIIPMGGGTALRLTIATYHTPSGNTPQRKDIEAWDDPVIAAAARVF